MQDDNHSKEDAPMISAAMPEENKHEKPTKHIELNKSHSRRRAPLIIGIVAGVIIVVVAGVLIAIGINHGEGISESEYSIKRDPETGERPLFGTDPNKDNSGEAYVKFQQRIINASDTTDAERFDAYISIAVYYNAIEEYDKAISTIQSINVNNLSDSQLSRYYGVLANIYESKGDTEKATEYRNMAVEKEQSPEPEQVEIVEQSTETEVTE